MRRILPVACVAFTFAVGLSAQTAGSGATETSTPQGSTTHKAHGSTAKSGGRAVTLTGCLREGATPGTYQLTNVDMSSMGAKSGKGSNAPGGTATSGSSASGSDTSDQAGMGTMGATGSINLVAGGTVDLKEHVGHRVQVVGNWANGSGTPGSSGTSGNAETRATNLGSAASIGGSTAGSQVGATATPTSPGVGTGTTGSGTGESAGASGSGSQSGTSTGTGTGSTSGQSTAGGQTGSQSGSYTGAHSATSGNDTNSRQLTVESLKHISDTCQ